MRILYLLALAMATLAPQLGRPVAGPDAQAPGFTAIDDRGNARSLTDFRGKWVVLEWHEKGCPYVAKHYRSGQMQALQKEFVEQGVAWLLVNSSAEGAHSFLTPVESRAYFGELKTPVTAALLDPAGTVGKLYGAQTALLMVIIDPSGKIVYYGAIDDQPKTEASSLQIAKNYVRTALAEAMAGKAVTTPVTTAYGCEIHYR